jgi:cold shock CspA family protein
VPDLDKLAHEIAALARGLAARRADLQASDQRPYVLNFLRALRHRADSPKMVTEAIASCISAVDPSSPLVAATGHIKMFSRTKGFGFIASNTQDYFFHHLGVVEPSNHILLVEGMQVEFEPLRDDQDRARADRVAPLPVDSTSALSNRVAQIQTVQETYCLTEDRDTSVTALVHRNAFHDHRDFDRLRESDLIRVDYELAERGPRGRSGSAHLLRRVH